MADEAKCDYDRRFMGWRRRVAAGFRRLDRMLRDARPGGERDIDGARRFVRALYRGVLRREPDDQGLATWSRAVLDGMSPASAAEAFIDTEEFRRGTFVKLFAPPGHFYSPIVHPAEANRRLHEIESRPAPTSLRSVHIDHQEILQTWNSLLPFLNGAPFGAERARPLRYGYDNLNYSWGDGSVLHAMLRLYRPRKLIEIGSGWSSACTIDTVERYLDGSCELTFIEPHPKLLRDLVGDAGASVRILECKVQDVPLTMFEQLEAQDVLFIDSTHVMRTGSDVCFELFEVLPRLAPGVLVHIHDMFWPFEYPRQWAVDENRSWNELYAVRAFLTNNSAWRVVVFNDYLSKLERPMIEATFPQFLNNSGGALWLQRRP
jgi:predicted O-methyltransferase YrrM